MQARNRNIVLRRRLRRRAVLSSQRIREEKRQHRQRRRVFTLIALAALAAIFSTGGVGAAMALVTSAGANLPARHFLPSDSIVYDRNGKLLAYLHPQGESRLPVSLDQMSPWLRKAIVDVEDRNFWQNGPVDYGRVASAAYQNFTHSANQQGASTITMQLGKLLYLTDDNTLGYKLEQVAVARRLASTMSHEQILAEYLNDVPFSNGALGAEAAANIYFGKHAKELDLAESAMLAGLPNAPTFDNPYLYPAAAKERQRVVLAAMVDSGELSQQNAAAAFQEQLHYATSNMDNINLTPAFVNRVVQEVKKNLGMDPFTAGLSIRSTLDWNLEQLATSTVQTTVAGLGGFNATDGALVSITPKTGEVVAYVGNAGSNVPGSNYDMASVVRQQGSTFKLMTYATALQLRKASILSPVLDGPIHVPDGTKTWSPNDYDGRWHGVVPLAKALGNSLNIPAIRVELLAGVPNVVATARTLGVTTLTQPASNYGASLTLGTYEMPLWQTAQAATSFADSGVVHSARFVIDVHLRDGTERQVPLPAPESHAALDPGVASAINGALTDDRNRYMEFGVGSDLTLKNHLVAAKTGTTDQFKDNLTVGWTPHLVTAVWVGNANSAPMHGTTGITGAAPIWHAFMTQALQGVPDDWPAPAADTHLATSFGTPGYLLAGTSPNDGASILLGGGNGRTNRNNNRCTFGCGNTNNGSPFG